MKRNGIVRNIVPHENEPEYTVIGEPVIVTTREPESRDELRLTRTQRIGEDAPRVDIRYFTVHRNGSETAHKGGLRLAIDEAAALLDALAEILRDK
jgi:hypothetical protein